MVLFSAMATAAGDFLSVHLAVIVRVLNISENLAGVTIFAFGNGSSDLFSTLAAMNSNSGSLAISELFGAGAFITTVVLGLIMVVQPFSVDPNTFVGDVLWFIIAATILMAFIADGHLTLSECLGIIGLYVAFVCFAILRAKNLPLERSTAEMDNTQSLEGHGELSEGGVGPLDENTPILPPDNSPPEARIACRGFAEQQTSSDLGEIRIDGQSSDAVVLNENTAERGLHSDDSSAASSVSETEPKDTEAKRTAWGWALGVFLGPLMTSWKDQNMVERALPILSIPFLILINLTTPTTCAECSQDPNRQITPEERRQSSTTAITGDQGGTDGGEADQTQHRSKLRLLIEQSPMCVQLVLGPQFVGLVILQQSGLFGSSILTHLLLCSGSVMLSVVLISCSSNASRYPSNRIPAYGNLITSILGFSTSLTWIYLTATSAVSLLTTLGMILHIPNAVLGASIFAIGNSSNDLVANIAVARRGFPVLAASACYGGPMMNMLLGIGGGGLVQALKHSREKKPSFEISPTLFISGATLVAALMVTLGYSFCNSWELNKRLGLFLIGIWTISTMGIVGVSMTTM